MKKIKIKLIIGVLVVLINGCRSTQTELTPELKPIPTSYSSFGDSTNATTVSWRDFYTDPYLISLIDSAIRNNPDAMIAVQRIEQAKAGVQFAKGQLLPTAGAVGIPAIRRFGLYTMDGAGNATTDIVPGEIVPVNLPDYLIGFQSSWEVDISGKLRNQKKSAVARYLSSVEGKNWLITNLVATLSSAYYELLALDQKLQIVHENTVLQENALRIVTIQKQAGAATELAVKQFEAQLLQTKSLEAELEQEIIETENSINLLMGRFPQPIVRDKERFLTTEFSKLNSGIPSSLLQNRPDIKGAELELIAAKADVRAARAAFYPSLQITGGIGFQAYRTTLLLNTPESFIFNLIGGLSAPLINRSAIKANFKGASAYQLETLYNYQNSILNGVTEVSNELTNLQNLQRILDLRAREVNVLNQAIDTSNELFKTGRATYLEVLLTQENTLDTRLDFIEIKKRQFQSNINLYKSLGGGWR